MANDFKKFDATRKAAVAAKNTIDRVHVFQSDGKEWSFKFEDWTIDGDDIVIVFTHNRKAEVVVLFTGHTTAYKFD